MAKDVKYKSELTDDEKKLVQSTMTKLFDSTSTYGELVDGILDADMDERLKVVAAFVAGETMAKNAFMSDLAGLVGHAD